MAMGSWISFLAILPYWFFHAMPTVGGSILSPFGVKVSMICWLSGVYFIGEFVMSKPLERKILNCISVVITLITKIAFSTPSSIFSLTSHSSNADFFTNASFQYGLRSILPGVSSKLTKFGHRRSMAFLKHGCVDNGWLVAVLLVCCGVVSANDLMVLLADVLDMMDYACILADDDFLANFFNKGFACCCSSLNTGFCDNTFLCISSGSSNSAIY